MRELLVPTLKVSLSTHEERHCEENTKMSIQSLHVAVSWWPGHLSLNGSEKGGGRKVATHCEHGYIA